MCADTSELVPSTAGTKQRYSFLISEWRRALSFTVTRGFASLKLCRIPFIRPTVASAVEAAKLQSNPAPSRFRTAQHGIVSTLETQPRTITTRRFGLAYAPLDDPLSSSLVVALFSSICHHLIVGRPAVVHSKLNSKLNSKRLRS
jgi:hypothetical protein